MGETTKARPRREREGWFTRYLTGKGIDIGCGDDPITPDCTHWDLLQGDAQYLKGVEDASFDWVYSSHCLEHMVDPSEALANWWRVLKPGGYLIVMVPDEDLYEQGRWPSHLNTDHKTTWTIHKTEGWSPVTRSLAQELTQLPKSQLVSLRLHDDGYRYDWQGGIEAHVLVTGADAAELKLHEHNTVPGHLFGFWSLDQSGMGAELSVEGIARKLA